MTALARLAAAAALCWSVSPTAAAQSGCADPAPNGQVVVHRDLLVSFSDGYLTRMDVYLPAVAPGSCGWPAILCVHSNRGNKGQMEDLARSQARRGYVALAFDLRGQGPSMALNDPRIYGRGELGLRERLDLFELLEAAEANFPAEIDFRRLGLAGPTQGGFSAWAAAAHSGKLPPPNPWRSAPFPVMAAVAAHDFSADLWEWMLPEASSMTEMLAFNLFADAPGLHNDPQFVARATPFLLAEDFAGLRRLLDQPELHLPTLLRSSRVPVLASLSYDDKFGPPNSLLEAWNAICPGAPKLLNLTTGGHNTPVNLHEQEVREHRQRLWFDRFLKDDLNGVDELPPLRMAVVPSDPLQQLSPDSLWDVREYPAWPPAPSIPERWYLDSGGTLSRWAPAAASGQDRLEHLNPSAYRVADYLAELPSPEALLKRMPLHGLAYDTAPSPRDQMLLGTSKVRLYVRCPDPAFQLHAALFDLDPAGRARYITGGATTVRNHPGGGASLLEFPLSAYGYVLRQGHRLRLQVENLAWHRPPMTLRAIEPERLPTFLLALPVFEPFAVDILRTPTEASHLELATVPLQQPRLVAGASWVDRDRPEDLALAIYSDSSKRGRAYQILLGTSGVVPPTPFFGVAVPLVFDALTSVCIQRPNQPPLLGFRGRLNHQGSARAEIRGSWLPPLPSAVRVIDLVALVEVPGGPPELTTSVRLSVD